MIFYGNNCLKRIHLKCSPFDASNVSPYPRIVSVVASHVAANCYLFFWIDDIYRDVILSFKLFMSISCRSTIHPK